MPHQCLKCGRVFEDGSPQLLKGCPDCGGNRFFFTKKPLDEKERTIISQKVNRDITEKIINGVFEVYNRLGPGFLESVYENALVIALEKRGLKTEKQKIYKIIYDNKQIGEHRLDLLVENKVILELKAVRGIMPDIYKAQVISYLRLTKLLVCLLINFGNDEIEIKRLQNKFELDKLSKD